MDRNGNNLFQQRSGTVPLLGIHVGGGQTQGRLRLIEGILGRTERVPGTPQIQRVLPRIEGTVVGVRHGPADQALQMVVSGEPGLVQGLLEGDDGLVVITAAVGDVAPLIP